MKLDAEEPLVSTTELAARLGDPALRLFDTTVLLRGKPGGGYEIASGRRDYEQGHIPGAAFMDLLEEFAEPHPLLRFMLPSPERFARAIAEAGVDESSWVVLYNSGPTWWATRAWFMLRHYGLERVSVLDGGLDAWRGEERPLEPGSRRHPRSGFVPKEREPRYFVGKETVLEAVQRRDRHLVNALSAEVYRGEVNQYGRPGRIAGSCHLFAKDLLDPLTHRFLPRDQLREKLSAAGLLDGRGVIAYCGGGISATTNAFALELLGCDRVQIYDGSMTEWGPDAALPMETG